MGRTENFNLSTISRGGSFDEDSYKYTTQDRETIDRLLRLAMEHDHSGVGGTTADPTLPLLLNLETTGGALAAGLRLYYKYSLVDASGNETAASPLAYVDTPNPIKSPSAPTFTALPTGGSLLPGTYYYIITAYTTVNTLETLSSTSNYVLISSATTTNEITLTLPSLPSGATGFNIYRKGPGNPRYYYLASTTGSSYVDDGATALTLSRTIPSANRTFSANLIEISYPGVTPSVPAGCTWKIYRSYDQTNWTNSMLHHVVEETSVGSGVIVTSYDDIGEGTSAGVPPETSMFSSTPDKINLTDATETTGTLPPGLLTVPFEVAFGQPGVVVEETGLLVWTCEFEDAEIVHVRASLGRGSLAINDIVFDVMKYTALIDTWGSVFDPGDRPTITTGGWRTAEVLPSSMLAATPTPTRMVRGDALTLDVVTANEDVATPTALGLTFSILMLVRSESETVSVVW